jgi:hypothetical protein
MRYLLLMTFLLAGCFPKHASNEQVIVESKKCLAGGMDYIIGDWGVVYCVNPRVKQL